MKKTKKDIKFVLILFIVIAFIAGIFTALLAIYTFAFDNAKDVEKLNLGQIFRGEEALMTNAAKNVLPAVVSIEVVNGTINKKNVMGGTGFIFDKSGLILTNKHVVKRADQNSNYEITFYDGTKSSAVLVDQDSFDDVAVLKIVDEDLLNPQKFPIVELGDSDNLQVGQKVMAIGNSLVTYDHSVSSGIISAVNRNVSAYYYDFKGPSENIAGLIQTDVPINLGNSGGPLIDLDGKVVGMVTAFEEGACGIGFAIPVNDFKLAISTVKNTGKIVRAALGVRFIMLTESSAKEVDPTLSYGAIVVGDKNQMKDAVIKKSNVYKAGLREGDVILSINDVLLDLSHSLNKVIMNYKPGDVVKLKFWRKGEEKLIDVTLNDSKDLE